MSDNNAGSPNDDLFGRPSGYAGAGKRARRPEPEETTPAPQEASTEPEPAAPLGWGEDPRPVAEEGLREERAFWSDIFTQSGQDPDLTATGSIPTITPEQVDSAPRASRAAGAEASAAEDLQPYDPFAPLDPPAATGGVDARSFEETSERIPPVTPEWEDLAEYTVEVPVVRPDDVPSQDPAPPLGYTSAAASAAGRRRATGADAPDATDDPGDPLDVPEPAASIDDHTDDAFAPEAIEDHGSAHEEPAPTAGGLGGFGGHGDENDENDEHHERKGRSKVGCLVLLVVLALVGAGLYLAADRGVDWIKDTFSGTEDYPGPGTGTVNFEVRAGEGGSEIGRNLKAAGVIKSVQSWTEAANAAGTEATNNIQPGTYALRKEMKASDAVSALANPANRSLNRVTIPEGLRVVDIVDVVSKKTGMKKADLEAALKDGKALGLPDFAKGNPEGFLFPATYEVSEGETAASLLKKMVDRWRQAAQTWDLEARAAKMDVTPYELMIIASLIQAEGRGKDMNKISRVIYNRLDNPTGPTAGFLGIDASQNYGLNKRGTVELTSAELAQETPYNLRKVKGLPPTPINSMGDDAIDAATHPAEGDWEWYVTVNLDTGETKFTKSPATFNEYKAEYKAWCDDNPGRCS